jgi:hypothetical protein
MEMTRRSASLTLATTCLVIAGATGLVWTAHQRPTGRSIGAGTAASSTKAALGVSTVAASARLITVTDGSAVALGSTGAELVVSSTSVCIRPANGVDASAAAVIPTGCFNVNDKNLSMAANHFASASYGDGTSAVVYGIAGPSAVTVEAWNGAGSTTGTVIVPIGANWVAFYAVLPFEPFVADAEHPVPPKDNVQVFDAQGQALNAA